MPFTEGLRLICALPHRPSPPRRLDTAHAPHPRPPTYSLDMEAISCIEGDAAKQLYAGGYLRSPTATVHVAPPELFKPPNGALKFTQKELSDLAKYLTGAPYRCLGILYAHTQWTSTSTRAILTMDIPTMAVLTMAVLTMAILTMVVPERGFLARIEDDRIAEIDAASGHEAYAESESASWAHPRHISGECPFDVWAWKVATFGWNWC